MHALLPRALSGPVTLLPKHGPNAWRRGQWTFFCRNQPATEAQPMHHVGLVVENQRLFSDFVGSTIVGGRFPQADLADVSMRDATLAWSDFTQSEALPNNLLEARSLVGSVFAPNAVAAANISEQSIVQLGGAVAVSWGKHIAQPVSVFGKTREVPEALREALGLDVLAQKISHDHQMRWRLERLLFGSVERPELAQSLYAILREGRQGYGVQEAHRQLHNLPRHESRWRSIIVSAARSMAMEVRGFGDVDHPYLASMARFVSEEHGVIAPLLLRDKVARLMSEANRSVADRSLQEIYDAWGEVDDRDIDSPYFLFDDYDPANALQQVCADFLMRSAYAAFMNVSGPYFHPIDTTTGSALAITGHNVRLPMIPVFKNACWTDCLPMNEVVEQQLFLRDDVQVLAITGPNTGGKTTHALLYPFIAMSRNAGALGPGQELSASRFPGGVFVLKQKGDDRHSGTSNFGNDLEAVHGLLEQRPSQALIVLDDLFAGGNHRESGALLRAVTEQFVADGNKVVITTNLETALPAANTPGWLPIRMEHIEDPNDAQAVVPTYIAREGGAGTSLTLAIARRRLPVAIMDRAQSILDEQ